MPRFVAMNTFVIDDCVVVPLVPCAAKKYAVANTLHDENVAASAWEAIYRNIANWDRPG